MSRRQNMKSCGMLIGKYVHVQTRLTCAKSRPMFEEQTWLAHVRGSHVTMYHGSRAASSTTITCDRNRSRVKVNTLLHCSSASTLTSAALHHIPPDNYSPPTTIRFIARVMRIHVVLSATLGIGIEAPRERALFFSIDCRTMLAVVRTDRMIECIRP